MNITIMPGAATDDAQRIDSIVQSIEGSLQELDSALKRNIPSGVETSWSEEVLNNWNSYYQADVPNALAEMKQSATNLRLAVDQALKFSQEQ